MISRPFITSRLSPHIHSLKPIKSADSRVYDFEETPTATSLATSAGLCRDARTNKSTPCGRLKVSYEINVTWTLDNYQRQ